MPDDKQLLTAEGEQLLTARPRMRRHLAAIAQAARLEAGLQPTPVYVQAAARPSSSRNTQQQTQQQRAQSALTRMPRDVLANIASGLRPNTARSLATTSKSVRTALDGHNGLALIANDIQSAIRRLNKDGAVVLRFEPLSRVPVSALHDAYRALGIGNGDVRQWPKLKRDRLRGAWLPYYTEDMLTGVPPPEWLLK